MSDALQAIGAIAACAAAALVLLGAPGRLRAAAMAGALILAGALIAGQAWDGPLASLRDEPAKLAALALAALVGIALLSVALARRRELLPLALLGMLAFRIPVDTAGESSNLLLPLYAVIAAGVAIELHRSFGARPGPEPGRPPSGPARWLALALAATLVLYALQSAYSSDLERATQNIGFFFVPFALLFALLREARWSPELLRAVLVLVVAEAVVFAVIGIAQHETRHIFWNEKAMQSNEFDLEFRVNSLFWDPNIYGRYLALSALLATAALSWVRAARGFAVGALCVAVIFAGLFFSYSQTSFFSLLAGLAVLGALRWSLRWTAFACAGAALAAVIAITFFSGSTVEVERGTGSSLDQTTSGRSRLARGGFELVKERPIAGFGSGSFAAEFEERNPVAESEAAASHTEPITIAAEQGAIGILVYLWLLAAAGVVLLSGLRSIAPGLGASPPATASSASRPGAVGEGPLPGGRGVGAVARIAVAVVFVALLVHTVGYAGFLSDPLSWVLLAIASALAAPSR